jgi:hypothetical protein
MTRKRKHQTNKAILEGFANKLTSKDANMKFKINPKGEISMSDAISELIEPFKDDAPDYNSFRNLITYGCIAWNAANLPVKEQDDLINKMLAAVPSYSMEDRLELLGLIAELMDRKKKLFPDISRMIIDFKVTDQGGNFHIAVASTLEKGKTAK